MSSIKLKNGNMYAVDLSTPEKIKATVTPEQNAVMITDFGVEGNLFHYEVIEDDGVSKSTGSNKKVEYSDYRDGVATFYLIEADVKQVKINELTDRVKSLEETIDMLVLNSLEV